MRQEGIETGELVRQRDRNQMGEIETERRELRQENREAETRHKSDG